MSLPIHQRYEIIFLFRHSLDSKFGHKSVLKAAKCSTSLAQIDGNSHQISTIQIELVEHVQRLQNRISKLFLLPNNRHSHKPRHHEPIEHRTSQDQLENDARTLERSDSKIQLAFVEGITHRKLSNESFKMGARSQSYRLESRDLFQRDNHSSKLRQRIALELT